VPYNKGVITAEDAIRRLQQAITRVDPRLELDRGAVRYVAEPFAGVEFGLRLGEAGSLLFMPEADLTADDWPERLVRRLEAARNYLEKFPQARSARPSGGS
jgi:hypothetical protein